MKIFILIIILVVYGTAFQQIINKNNKVEQVLSDLGGADIDKGEAITQTILDQSKAIFEQAYVFNGESISANVQYIRTKMNQLYEGNYAIIIFNDNTTSPIINTNLQFSIQSINNSWWFYWKGPNHYKPTYAYYIARNAKNTSGTSLVANGNDSSTYYNTTTKNVINAVQQDSSDISYNVKTIKSYISALNTTRKVSIIISKNISYYLSVQGITGYDHYSPTFLQKFHDLIWYTV